MPQEKTQWMSAGQVPAEARPLLEAYNAAFGLHNTNNVVRFLCGEDYPVVQIQHYGRVSAGQIAAVEETAGCRVEIEGLGPGYVVIMLFGGQPKSGRQLTYDKAIPHFLFRPFRR